jgi:subtilisin family serine protease
MEQWHHLDAAEDKVIGISTRQAYKLLETLPAPKQPREPVVVAVIDGGFDTGHEDLKSRFWINKKEVAGNGKDDDKNGYSDDFNGWNFLGSKDGKNLIYEQKEETRLYKKLSAKFGSTDTTKMDAATSTDFALWKQIKPYYERKLAELRLAYTEDSTLLAVDRAAYAALQSTSPQAKVDSTFLKDLNATDTSLVAIAQRYLRWMRRANCPDMDCVIARFEENNKMIREQINSGYNLDQNDRALVGDNPANTAERFYGNADLSTPLYGGGAAHGTHVTGIIAAERNNNLGVNGVASEVRIMAVRAAPDGDERDKDIANAIRYAVDNGAKIINMSFGKAFSPEKKVVDDAMRYAGSKGVFLVHAAGNDASDNDSIPIYPSSTYLDGNVIPNLITVGASGKENDRSLVRYFSNYGKENVDVFAPGMEILSTVPGGKYDIKQGTSMAAPVVAGIAAVLKYHFPKLTPEDLKRIIMKSAVPYHTQVLRPGTETMVDFTTLSRTGGIVNLYEAVKLAVSEK